jgi:hypothetical protein
MLLCDQNAEERVAIGLSINAGRLALVAEPPQAQTLDRCSWLVPLGSGTAGSRPDLLSMTVIRLACAPASPLQLASCDGWLAAGSPLQLACASAIRHWPVVT